MKTDNCTYDLVTTGEAAELCGVTPDTILKWIKKGKLQVARTAGGHHRIRRDSLRPYLAIIEHPAVGHSIPPCWEFHATTKGIRAKCRKCSLYLRSTGAVVIDYQI